MDTIAALASRKLAAQWRRDPLTFVKLFWPEMRLYPKQVEILRSVALGGRTFVHAANGVGKTRTAALVALWFLCSRSPAKVITSSSSNRQLKKVLWGEIGTLVRSAKYDLGFKRNDLELYREDATGSRIDNHFCIGLVTNTVETFQGHHLNLGDGISRTLAMFDEASGVGDAYYEAAESWAETMAIFGNPLHTKGFFYRHCRQGNGPRQRVIHISADDSPNVQFGKRWVAAGYAGDPPQVFPGVISWDKYSDRMASWDAIKRLIRLEGKFFEDDSVVLFPPSWLDKAQDEFGEIALAAAGGPFAIGCDTAGRGRDFTVWVVLGPLGVRLVIVRHEPDSMRIVGETRRLMDMFHVQGRRVCFDSGGGGKECADRLRELGYQVRDVNFGAGARDKRQYANMRAELYGRLRSRLDPSQWPVLGEEDEATGVPDLTFGLPPTEDKLREELAVLPMSVDSEGRLKLPPKDRATGAAVSDKVQTIRDMIGRSPDRADALVLAHEALCPPKGFELYVDRDLVLG